MSAFATRKNRYVKPERLSRSFGFSFLIHAALIVLFSLKLIFFPDDPLLLESAIRVDMVGLPDKLKEPPAPAVPDIKEEKKVDEKPVEVAKPVEPAKVIEEKKPALPVKEIPQEDAINLQKTKSKQQEALEKLKKMSAIDKIRKELETPAKKSEVKPAVVKGNVLATGTALTGLNKLQHDQYLSALDQHIKKNWFLPEFLKAKSLRAQVRVMIDENGMIVSRSINLSSGHKEYDATALAAIERSEPFPPPPEKFRDIVRYTGILVGFPE